jgi:hypothetical protein
MEAMMTIRSDDKHAIVPGRGTTVRPEAARTSRTILKQVPAPSRSFPARQPLHDRDESDPHRCTVELVQRGRLILDVSTADLEAAEATFGAFHPTTWYFRSARNESQRSWERLCAELGSKTLKAALEQPPLTALTLDKPAHGGPRVVLILIAGQTYRSQQVPGTDLAPVQWRLTRLNPPLENGPYYICRLADGSTQCDCADWTYQIAETNKIRTTHCKHVSALAALGWI